METSIAKEFKRTWLTSTIGLLLGVGGIWLLSWNEERAVRHYKHLEEAARDVIVLNVYDRVRPEIDGSLVHISGYLLIDEPLTEPEYGIAIQAVKLKRRVQIFQWIEERTQSNYDNIPDVHMESGKIDTDYYYVTDWRDRLIDSNSFYIRYGHQNPTEMPLKSQVSISPSVRVGQLVLGNEIKEKFKDYSEITSDERPDRKDIKMHDGMYYHCHDIWNPEVGDYRVQFSAAGHSGDPVTVIAVQKNGVLVPYVTSTKHEIVMLRHGLLSPKQMFEAEHFDAKLETWKYRAFGIIALLASSLCLDRIINLIRIKVPALRQAFSSDYCSILVASSLGCFVIALAWFSHRPVVAVSLLSASMLPVISFFMSLYNGVANLDTHVHNT